MERAGIRAEEKTGLIVAVVLHLAVLALLLVQAMLPAPSVPKTERMTVSLAEDVGMEATAPDPVSESRASIAPQLSETPAPPQPDEPATTPSETTQQATSNQRSQPAQATGSSMRQIMRPNPAAQPRNQQPRPDTSPPRRTERSGGSRLGENFRLP